MPAVLLQVASGQPMSKHKDYPIHMYERAMAISASPFERLTTMYTGAIRHCKQGLEAAERGDEARAADKAKRLRAIVLRLDASLDFKLAPELCTNLSQIYVHILGRLDQPGLAQEPEVFREILQLLETLWDGFQRAEDGKKG